MTENKCCNKPYESDYISIEDLTPGSITSDDFLLGVDSNGDLAAFYPSASGGGMVDDVLVNGESVVTNKVANIDLTEYTTVEVTNELNSALNNEILRVTDLESKLDSEINDLDVRLESEIQRATQASQDNTTRINNTNLKLNQNVVIDLGYTASATGITRSRTFKNLFTDVESTTTESMPIVNNTQAGIVLPDLFNTVNDNTNRIDNLEANTSVEITDQPTKAALDAFVLPPNAKEGDTAIVQSDETQGNVSTRYKLDSGLNWVFNLRYGAPTPQATNTTLGTVKGNTSEGTIAIETDGSMSVNGWDGLKNSIPTQVSQLTNDVGYITNSDINIQDATSTIKGIATLGSTGGAARYGYKEDVGLSNVDNTSDSDKPISLATQTVLSNKLDKSSNISSLYAVLPGGDQGNIRYSQSAETDAVVQRNNAGDIPVRASVTGNIAIGQTQVAQMIAESGGTETDPVFTTWKNSASIVAGDGATNNGTNYNVVIGEYASTNANNTVVIGSSTNANGMNSIAIKGTANGPYCVAIGGNTGLNVSGAVQIGQGTNTTTNTLQFRNYPIIDPNGKVYNDRLNIWKGTQAEYSQITTKDPNVIYFVIE